MTIKSNLKIAGFVIAAIGLTTGTAIAGEGHCKDKKQSAMMKTEAPAQTMVLPAATEKAGYPAKKTMQKLTFDQALSLCQKHGAADLQACIDKKTGQSTSYKPKS